MLAIPDVESTCRQNKFRRDSIDEGLAYARAGRVLKKNIIVRHEYLEINALVQGSRSRPYKVNIEIEEDEGKRVIVDGECSCPVAYNCKHVVAALAAAAADDDFDTQPLAHIGPVETKTPPAPMSYELSSWLARLNAATTPPTLTVQKQLIFVLDSARPFDHRVPLQLMTRNLKKNGQWGKATRSTFSYHNAQQILVSEPFQIDADILRQLFGENGFTSDQTLAARFGAALLQKIIATGRCYWKDHASPPLTLADLRPAVPAWRELPDGAQQATFDVSPAATDFLPLDPPWFIDAANHIAGPLQISGAPNLARSWLLAPKVPPEQSVSVAKSSAQINLPAPRPIEVITRRSVMPTPVIHLLKVRFPHPVPLYYSSNWRDQHQVSELDIARIQFDYEGTRISRDAQSGTVDRKNGLVITKIERQRGIEERRFHEALNSGLEAASQRVGFGADQQHRDALLMISPQAWLDWMTKVLPDFQDRGWRIDIDPSFSFRPAAIDDWYSETTAPADAGNDWFAYELGIIVEGQRVNLLPMLGELLKHLKDTDSVKNPAGSIVVRLPDGRVVNVPAERLRTIAATLAEIFDPHALKDGRLEIGRLRAAELIDLHDTAPWRGPSDLRDLAQKIRSFAGIAPLPPPPSLNATLRPYQLDGLSWLQFLREHNFGGILADDMGLGKTVQALAHILAEKNAGRATIPSLVVAPTSLMPNWRAEAEKFAPDLKVLISHGTDRKEQFDNIQNHDLIVTSYALLPRDREILEKQSFHLLILDEAQYIKNPRTQWAEIARNLKSNHRLCMTGTPMENHLGELWSLMHFLSPGYLGPEKQFRKIYRDPIEKLGDTQRRAALAQRVRPFIMRRKKEDVAQDLPEKTEIIRNLELEGPQRDLYETIRLAMHEKVQQEVANKGLSPRRIVILDALLKLRQVCCDPRLVKLERARSVTESAKLELLTEMLPELIAEGRKILLFSQFTSMLDLIELAVNKLDIPFVRLTGDTTDRETPVKKFQAGEVPLFLISLKAGGTGLNLTAADTVIHYDPWWNPAVETQATDRAHRIGQTKKVFVYKLVTTGTVEEKILAMQQRKKELVAGLLADGAQQNLQLTQSDLNHLFDPL